LCRSCVPDANGGVPTRCVHASIPLQDGARKEARWRFRGLEQHVGTVYHLGVQELGPCVLLAAVFLNVHAVRAACCPSRSCHKTPAQLLICRQHAPIGIDANLRVLTFAHSRWWIRFWWACQWARGGWGPSRLVGRVLAGLVASTIETKPSSHAIPSRLRLLKDVLASLL